jgi:hypothetical protein
VSTVTRGDAHDLCTDLGIVGHLHRQFYCAALHVLEVEMKTAAEIKEAINEIEADDRMKGKPALLASNGPLALIQCHLEGELQALRWVLNEVLPKDL